MMTGKELLDKVEKWATTKNLSPTRKPDIIRAGNENGMMKFWLSDDAPDGWCVDGTGEYGTLMCDAVIDLLSDDADLDTVSEVDKETTPPKKREGKMIPPKPAKTTKNTPKTTITQNKTSEQTLPAQSSPVPEETQKTQSTMAKNKVARSRQPEMDVGAGDKLQIIQDAAAKTYKARGGK